MHEASLVQGLLNIVFKAARQHSDACPDGQKLVVKEIICEAGLLACFEIDTLLACFEMFAAGTMAENAKLEIKTAPLACVCDACGARFELRERHFVCPVCAHENISFSGGNGLTIQAINVECEENENG